MEQKELREWESRCIQEEPPGCTAGCPLNVDARGFVQAMAKGDMAGARAVLERAMPLVGITARLCEAPCEDFCLRRDLGGSIAVGSLERACVDAVGRRGKILCLPSRGQKTAVLGSGPSSLIAAFDLIKKGYAVSIFSLSAPGGWLHDLDASRLPPEILVEELAILAKLAVRFESMESLSRQVLNELRVGYQAMYIGRDGGSATELEDLLAGLDEEVMALPELGLFAGGIAGAEQPGRYIASIAQGRAAALSMDRFLQGASLTAARPQPRGGRTDLFTAIRDILPAARIVPRGRSTAFAPDEARLEAERCIDCQCLECVRHCVYLQEFGSYPKVYARRVYNNEAIVKGTHQTNTFINSCSLCGQCTILCPRDFSVANLCLEARQRMVDEARIPPSAHAFALDEMRSALGPQIQLVRHAPGRQSSRRVLFPGCQLAGIRPGQILALYHHLLGEEADTGIWLGCCGAPAHWAGRKAEFRGIGEQFQESWQEMGRPQVLACCSSCLLMFRDHLPEVEVESIWTVLAASWKTAVPVPQSPPLALADPCAARADAPTRAAVRTLLAALGQELTDLPMSEELTECCGFGGLMDNANPPLAAKVLQRRISQTSAGFLTYCIMCREQLARTTRPVLHVLDLLFPETALRAEEPPLGLSSRRENRRRLHATILEGHSGEHASAPEAWRSIRLQIGPELVPILEERRILEEDIRQVLWRAGQEGQVFCHGSSSTRLASAHLGEVTFWVQYELQGEVYRLQRCWSHRMRPTGGQQ